jgi:hypothetical protein
MELIPQVKCICPSCFEEIKLGDCDIVDGNGKKVLKKASKWLLGRIFIESLDGALYTGEDAHRRCYRCGYLLPYNIEYVRSVSLSVVGDTSSGKSNYLTSLIHQIVQEWGNHPDNPVQIDCLTADVEEEFLRRYHGPLYINNMAVRESIPARNDGTPEMFVNRPLIYQLDVNHSASRPDPSTMFNLMIYDTAGEDFAKIDRLVKAARFALNSSALVFVADPFAMDTVYQQLPAALQSMVPPDKRPGNRPPNAAVLQGVLRAFMRRHGLLFHKRLTDVPVAIMVSKADVFTQAIAPRYPYSYANFLHRPTYGAGVDLDDLNGMDQEVRKLLEYYQQGSILGLARRLERVRFFATSATGVPQDSPDHFPSVDPWRCLDPMMWIFHELGLMRSL